MIPSRRISLALALAAAPLPAAAQEADTVAALSCAEQGMRRLAVMVPPGRTAEDVRKMAQEGQLAPEGTEVFILPAGRFTAMRNEREFAQRMNSVLYAFMHQRTKVDGTISFLLQLNDDGTVAAVFPNTGDRHVDRDLERVWKTAEFDPYIVNGCRVAAWIHVPLAFRSDYSLTERRVEVKPGRP